MKTEIINLLQTTQAFNGGNQGIDARYVYRLLKVGRDYSKWIKARIEQAGFIENQDFAIVQSLVVDLPKLANGNPDYFLRNKMGEQKKAVRRNHLTARQLEKFPKDTFMKKFHVYSSIDENFNKPQALQSAVNFGMIPLQSQKTIAEPRNSTYLQLAHSTPEACFFMRNIRTPKEFADFVFIHQIYKFLSMVACSGKGSPFAVFQLSQFSRPLHVTAKASKLSAVALKCLQLELLAMIYLFNAIKRTDFNNTELNIYTFPKSIIRVQAESLEQAKGLLSRDYFVINTGRINLRATKNLVSDTFNQGLSANKNACSIVGTTTQNGGNRSRYERGIFLSQIPFNGYRENPHTYQQAEFAVRATHGNKAEIIRANNVGYHNPFSVVVEPLPRLLSVRNSKFTKKLNGNPTMKIYPQTDRTLSATTSLSVSAEMEVAHG